MKVVGQERTKYSVALLAIVLIGTFLRVYQLGAQSIWFDEAFSVWISKMGLLQIVQLTAADVHPPFYYFILHYWMGVFRDSEFAVRLLSAVFGILAIPVIYLVGRQLFDEEVGLLSALILALSSFNIQYSQETRMYTLMVLLALASMYFLLRFLQHSSLAISVGYVLSTTLLLYTHLYGLFVLVAQNIYFVTLLVLSKNRTFQVRDWVILQAIVIALFVPWIPFLAKQTSSVLTLQSSAGLGGGFRFAPPTAGAIVQAFTIYSGTTVLLVLFLGLSVLSLFTFKKIDGSWNWKAPLKVLRTYSWEVRTGSIAAVWLLALWLWVINIIPFVISRLSVSIYYYRYTIAASIALYLLVAAGLRNISENYLKVAVLGVVVVLSVMPLQTYYTTITKPQAREAIGFVDASARSGDAVIVFPDYHSVVIDYYNKRTDIDFKPFGSLAKSIDENSKELNLSINSHDRVWFICADYGRDAHVLAILKTLNASYETVLSKHYVGYNVYFFEKRA